MQIFNGDNKGHNNCQSVPIAAICYFLKITRNENQLSGRNFCTICFPIIGALLVTVHARQSMSRSLFVFPGLFLANESYHIWCLAKDIWVVYRNPSGAGPVCCRRPNFAITVLLHVITPDMAIPITEAALTTKPQFFSVLVKMFICCSLIRQRC